MTPVRYNDGQLNLHQLVEKMESMDYEEYGPSLRTSPTPETSPRIREFLQQRLNVNDQSTRLWYRMNNLGKL
jgi:hypothetical protein